MKTPILDRSATGISAAHEHEPRNSVPLSRGSISLDRLSFTYWNGVLPPSSGSLMCDSGNYQRPVLTLFSPESLSYCQPQKHEFLVKFADFLKAETS
jgi:hypothetical protein